MCVCVCVYIFPIKEMGLYVLQLVFLTPSVSMLLLKIAIYELNLQFYILWTYQQPDIFM